MHCQSVHLHGTRCCLLVAGKCSSTAQYFRFGPRSPSRCHPESHLSGSVGPPPTVSAVAEMLFSGSHEWKSFLESFQNTVHKVVFISHKYLSKPPPANYSSQVEKVIIWGWAAGRLCLYGLHLMANARPADRLLWRWWEWLVAVGAHGGCGGSGSPGSGSLFKFFFFHFPRSLQQV